MFSVSQEFKQDEAQVWNFSIERQLPGNMMAQIAYVGTHGLHLYRDLQLNQSLPGPGPIGPRLPFLYDRTKYSDGGPAERGRNVPLQRASSQVQKRYSNGLIVPGVVYLVEDDGQHDHHSVSL